MGYDDRYDPDADFDRWYTRGTGEAIAHWVHPGEHVLELGCATGLMSAQLVKAGATVVGIDRAASYLERARARGLSTAEFIEGDITAIEIDQQFDHVVAANVAHEVPDLAGFLRVARGRLHDGGLLHVSLQNPRSLHRLVGLAMGAIDDLHEVSARGQSYETLRLLDVHQIVDAVSAVGLECVHREGIMLKPLPNELMSSLPEQVLEGFLAIAPELPDHCAMNYLVFR
jgi:2-polyprenyl-3-methyl-5-hydroxy-6-metoxy-1,4-benzoquinol methylase